MKHVQSRQLNQAMILLDEVRSIDAAETELELVLSAVRSATATLARYGGRLRHVLGG